MRKSSLIGPVNTMDIAIKQESFAKRDAEKQALRDRDIVAVENGASAKEIRSRNFMFSGLNMSEVVVVAPNGHRFSHPE